MKSLSQLNSFSAQSVPYDDQGTGAQTLADRYQINGLIDTSKSVMENIEKICSAAGSWLSYDITEGKWGVVINTTGTSIASFNDSNILGNITVSGTGLNDLYNSVKVEFPHRELRDSADFVTIEIADEDRNANEEDNTLNLTYDIINEPIQAEMLGLIELKQSRIDLVITFQTDYSNIGVKAGDLIDVTNARFGFTNKLFRVITTTEAQDDDGAIRIEISALEYDPNVYAIDDLYRYTRTDENGIITIGSIGIPGTPQVTKFEVDARPRILIETTAPTGVVEGIEFWLSDDALLPEANRSYRLVAVEKPAGGGVFTSGQEVETEYVDNSDGYFVVKTRGVNALTVGPFSTPSGLVQYNPIQTTDAIGPSTQTIDATGQLATLLGTSLLLKAIDGVFFGDSSTSSFFTAWAKIFKSVTGEDVLADRIPIVNSINPSSGPDTGGTDVVIYGEYFTGATDVTFDGASAASFAVISDDTIFATTPQNFAGPSSVIVVTPNGSSVAGVVFTYTGEEQPPLKLPIINAVNPDFGPFNGGTPVTISGQNFTGATSVTFNNVPLQSMTVVSDTSITGITPPGEPGSVNIVVTTNIGNNAASGLFTYSGGGGSLAFSMFYPPDRITYQDPITGATSDTAPIYGSYYMKMGYPQYYGPVTRGSGNAYLYKSDGTLVQTLSASQLNIVNNLVGFPFAPRELGTDYYILMDEGLVNYCNAISVGVTTPNVWNFNTPLYEVAPYDPPSDPPSPIPDVVPEAVGISTFGYFVSLSFNTQVIAGTGNFSIYRKSDNQFALSVPVAQTVIDGPILTFPDFKGVLQDGETYYVTASAGYVSSYVAIDCFIASTPAGVLTPKEFTLPEAFQLIEFVVDPAPLGDMSKINPQTNIGLVFNKTISFTDTGTITIYKANGTVHQAIDVTTNFNQNRTNELIWISGTNFPNDTVTINPTRDLTLGETYYVLATPTCVESFSGELWTGLSNPNVVRFTVDPGPKATINAVGPATRFIEMTFDRQVEASTGLVEVFTVDDVKVESFDLTDPAVDLE